MKRVLVIVAILAAAAACGGSTSTSSTTGSNAYLGQSAPVAGPQPVKGAQQAGGTAAAPADAVPAIQGPQVIRQAQLSISVGSGSFDSKLADIHAIVQSEQGSISGADAQANPATNDRIRAGVITFMVPADKFDETIDKLTKLGRLQNEHISGNDVSGQYVDLRARLVNEEAQRDAMLALLQRAQSVPDIIAIRTQLGQITGQIEQLKGQIRYIDTNTTYSTVTVDLTEAGAPAQAPPQDNWGFVSALSDAAHNFVSTINYLISGLGAIGPIVILLGLGYLLWRRRGLPGWPTPRHV